MRWTWCYCVYFSLQCYCVAVHCSESSHASKSRNFPLLLALAHKVCRCLSAYTHTSKYITRGLLKRTLILTCTYT